MRPKLELRQMESVEYKKVLVLDSIDMRDDPKALYHRHVCGHCKKFIKRTFLLMGIRNCPHCSKNLQ